MKTAEEYLIDGDSNFTTIMRQYAKDCIIEDRRKIVEFNPTLIKWTNGDPAINMMTLHKIKIETP